MDRRGLPDSTAADETDAAVEAMSHEEARRLLPSVIAGLRSTPLWQLSEGELREHLAMLGSAENQVVAAQVAVVGEAVSRGLPAKAGHKTGGQWLRSILTLTPGAAYQRGALAQQLPNEEMAPTAEAFAAGDIAVGHAAVIARTMAEVDRVPEIDAVTWTEVQALLVDEAHRIDPAQLGRAAAHLRARLDPGGNERLARDEDRQHELRQATLVQESSGMWFLNAALPSTGGAMLATALDVLAAPQPGRDALTDTRTKAQRYADALVGLGELSLTRGAGEVGGLPGRHGSPVRLVVTADLAALAADVTRRGGQLGVPAGVLETGQPGGAPVSPLTLQMWACDAEVVPALLDGDDRPLDVGQSMYRFPLRIRRAIELRDRHCTFPECAAPPTWCQTHHLVPFGRNGREGGPTSEANGTLLCGRHHRHVHAQGWVGTLVDGRVHWRPPRPGESYVDSSDHARRFQTKLRQLALRWLSRQPRPPDTS